MRTERALRYVIPPVLAQRTLFRVQGIEDAIVRSARLADDEQTDVLVRIVDEGVANPGTGRKADAVPGHQLVDMAVDPGVRIALNDVDELLLRALGMRVGCPPAWWQQLMMDAEPREAEDPTEREPMLSNSSLPG